MDDYDNFSLWLSVVISETILTGVFLQNLCFSVFVKLCFADVESS